MLVWQRREWYRRKLPGLQPMHSGSIYGYCFFWSNIWSVFQVIMLPLLSIARKRQRSMNYPKLSPISKCNKRENRKWFFELKITTDNNSSYYLFSLQPKASQSSKVFPAHRLVNSCSSSYTFTIVVSNICPPISFGFDIAENHVLNRNRQTRDLINK